MPRVRAKGVFEVGENSKTKYKWIDTDGVYAPGGCVLTIKGITQAEYSGGTWGKWIKVSGTPQAPNGTNYSAFTTC